MSSFPLRIAYFGLPLGALALARAGFTPSLIALGHPDAPGARRVRRELSRYAPVLGKPNLNDPEIQRLIAEARPEVLLCWFWPKRIPEGVLALAPRGAFGVHPSLLPRWRGPDPYYWAILAGDVETGVSLHRLDREYDTGNVVARRTLAIRAGDNAWRLAKRLDRPGLALLVEAAQALARGELLEGETQDETLVTEAPQPTEDDLSIDWNEDVDGIIRRVRALAPYPGAASEFGDEPVDILAAQPFDEPLPRALEPGDAVLSARGVVIRAGQSGVLLQRVRDAQGRILRGQEVMELFPSGLFRLSNLRR